MVLTVPQFETSNWVAWEVNLRTNLKGLRVKGDVTLPTPGYTVILDKAIPQGISPTQLILRLTIVKLPRNFPEIVTTQPVSWEDEPTNSISYGSVLIELPERAPVTIDEILKNLPQNESDELTIYFAPPLPDAETGLSLVGTNILARYQKEIASGVPWVETDFDVFPPSFKKYRGDVWVTLDHPRINEITGAINDCLVGSALVAAISAVVAGIFSGGGAIPAAAITAFKGALIACLTTKGVAFAKEISVNLEIRNKR
jgi:hypothetical protein